MNTKTLIVLVGPTGVGKTELSLQLAENFACPIISSDSRQIYKELKIGTAAPDEMQLGRVKHYFIGVKNITDNYNAGQYEFDVLHLLDELFLHNDVVMLVGGSMMYVDAVCSGLDDIPTISPEIRNQVALLYNEFGIDAVCEQLKRLDVKHYHKVDLNNKQRVMHALEVCLMTGAPYSNLLKSETKKRTFNILKVGLNLPRELLYERINSRVDVMLEDGLLDEVKSMYPFKHLNSLNTVGYKELFDFLEGKSNFDFAVNMIKQNSRRYAKRQLTWFNADKDIHWFTPYQYPEILEFVLNKMSI